MGVTTCYDAHNLMLLTNFSGLLYMESIRDKSKVWVSESHSF